MKNVIIAALFSAAAIVPAYSADVSLAPASTYDWSGFFVGANVGGAWGDNTYNYVGSSVDFSTRGAVGGIGAGYNWQFGEVVLGAEVDASLSSIDGSRTVTPFVAPCGNEGCSADVDWFGTLRAKAGYAFGGILPYITAGGAVGKIKGTADIGACGFGGSCSYSDTRWGWSAGAGVEWGMTDTISLKAEYLHVDLGKTDFATLNPPDPSTDRINFDTVRVGLNVRF